jgi:hypothetical protein
MTHIPPPFTIFLLIFHSSITHYRTKGEGCSATDPAIRNRIAPYMYNQWASHLNTQAAKTQSTSFLSQMLTLGIRSPATDADDALSLSYFALPSDLFFFGTKVNKLAISPNGYVSFPPRALCSSTSQSQCVGIDSGSNVVSPWHADWNPLQVWLNCLVLECWNYFTYCVVVCRNLHVSRLHFFALLSLLLSPSFCSCVTFALLSRFVCVPFALLSRFFRVAFALLSRSVRVALELL